MLEIAILVGSTRRESINRKLANALVKLGDGRFEPIWVRIDDLPLSTRTTRGRRRPRSCA